MHCERHEEMTDSKEVSPKASVMQPTEPQMQDIRDRFQKEMDDFMRIQKEGPSIARIQQLNMPRGVIGFLPLSSGCGVCYRPSDGTGTTVRLQEQHSKEKRSLDEKELAEHRKRFEQMTPEKQKAWVENPLSTEDTRYADLLLLQSQGPRVGHWQHRHPPPTTHSTS